jgi:phosphoribosyl 1,2-cyclic phosphodiesterase
VAYRIAYGNKRVAICTDLGVYNDYTVECLKGMDALLIEANHDVNMLQVGPYPYHLKQRILGERGHLSNESSAKLARYLAKHGTKNFVLGHLSKENNYPMTAEVVVRSALSDYADIHLAVASPDEPTKIV